MSDIDTAEYRKLALIAAGVSLQDIPPIIDTATWRKMMIAALLKNTANQAIAGSVDYYGQLPISTGNPPIGTTYLVKNSSGIYYINYKSAGVYVKLTDTGSLSDWVYAPLSALGTLPDVTLTNQQVGQTITWNGSRWVNTNTFSPTITNPQVGQTLTWNGSQWVNTTPFAPTISVPQVGDVIAWNGTSWINTDYLNSNRPLTSYTTFDRSLSSNGNWVGAFSVQINSSGFYKFRVTSNISLPANGSSSYIFGRVRPVGVNTNIVSSCSTILVYDNTASIPENYLIAKETQIQPNNQYTIAQATNFSVDGFAIAEFLINFTNFGGFVSFDYRVTTSGFTPVVGSYKQGSRLEFSKMAIAT